jgi:hypothetical protein
VRRKLGRFGTRVRARHFRGRAASLGGLLVRRRAHPLSLVVWTWHATLGAQTLDAPAASLVARIGWSRAAMLRRPPCTDGLFTLIANREFIKNALQQFTHGNPAPQPSALDVRGSYSFRGRF